jgi:hypothetical protein
MALSGPIRDLVNAGIGEHSFLGLPGSANGYVTVYVLEILLLVVTIVATLPLIERRLRRPVTGLEPLGGQS